MGLGSRLQEDDEGRGRARGVEEEKEEAEAVQFIPIFLHPDFFYSPTFIYFFYTGLGSSDYARTTKEERERKGLGERERRARFDADFFFFHSRAVKTRTWRRAIEFLSIVLFVGCDWWRRISRCARRKFVQRRVEQDLACVCDECGNIATSTTSLLNYRQFCD